MASVIKNGFRFLLFFMLYFSLGISISDAQLKFNLPLIDAVKPDGLVLGGSAVLTANGVIDPAGGGWLRLTSDKKSQQGWAYIDQAFAPGSGLFVQFEYKVWSAGGSGSDGLGDGLSGECIHGGAIGVDIPDPDKSEVFADHLECSSRCEFDQNAVLIGA